VKPNGAINFRAHQVNIGAPLRGQSLGFKQTDEDEWEIHYGPLLIGFALLRKYGLRIERIP
jgi:hypothetical protein